MSERNLTFHAGEVGPEDRARLLGHQAAIVWLTGLSGSGKSTLCRAAERALIDRRALAYVLDGDNVRLGLNSDLGFSPRDREENIRRIGEVAKIVMDSGAIVLSAFISPFRADRARVRARVPAGRFLEVHVATPIEECEHRDPKGLYVKARRGEIADFTGVSSPYEPPECPDLVLGHDGASIPESTARILTLLEERAILPGR